MKYLSFNFFNRIKFLEIIIYLIKNHYYQLAAKFLISNLKYNPYLYFIDFKVDLLKCLFSQFIPNFICDQNIVH